MENFLENLAKPQPDPGGGAAAAYGGLLALALMEKIAQLERRRDRKNPSREDFWRLQLAAAGTLSREFSRLLAQDIHAYGALQAALKQGHPDTIREAIGGAVECPRQLMAVSDKALAAIMEVGRQCKKYLLADLLVAAELLGAMLQGAYHIASANLPLLADLTEQEHYRTDLNRALADGLESLGRTRHMLSACQAEPFPPDEKR